MATAMTVEQKRQKDAARKRAARKRAASAKAQKTAERTATSPEPSTNGKPTTMRDAVRAFMRTLPNHEIVGDNVGPIIRRSVKEQFGMSNGDKAFNSTLGRMTNDGELEREIVGRRTKRAKLNEGIVAANEVVQRRAPQPSGSALSATIRISSYLEAVKARKRGPGQRVVDPAKLRERIADTQRSIQSGDLSIVQELDKRAYVVALEQQLADIEKNDTFAEDEQYFIEHGKEWAQARKFPIPYGVFRSMGVEPEVLENAGITR